MPTTEPLDDGDYVGGPLNSIAEFHTAQPANPAQTANPAPKPQPAPAAKVVPSAPPQQPAATTQVQRPLSPIPAGGPKPVVYGPVVGRPKAVGTHANPPREMLSLNLSKQNDNAHGDSTTGGTASSASNLPANDFSNEQLAQAWASYINSHGQEQLLVHTMRAHTPERQPGSFALKVEVDSDIQAGHINEAMPRLLDHLHGCLSNHSITIKVTVKEGPGSPSTWNEREVLADMLRRHAEMRQYITKLGLTLS